MPVHWSVDRAARRAVLTFGYPYTIDEWRKTMLAILGMYGDLPGLRLDLGQAARLFGLRVGTCRIVLDDLVRNGQLHQAEDGQYAAVPGTQ